ncbi:hypothetical protein K439DRAFT_1621935 [Ramaria rubella]|nr:hypothetical protein K439DRAFT_1621935 [Ramaria rubella]
MSSTTTTTTTMHPTAKHPHYPTIPTNLFYEATKTSRNPGCHVEGISTPPNVAPTSLPLAPLYAPHTPQDSYMHHIHEPYAPYMRQSPSYTQAHSDSCPPSPLGAPPPLAAWPSTPGIGTWIYGVNSRATDSPVPLATRSNSSESLPGSTPSSTLSAIPPALTTKIKNGKMATQAREDFSIQDLDQLLHTVIQVNPYLVTHKRVGEKWWEVTRVVQEGGFCKGRDADTLKNKVASLLQWVENSSQVSSHTALRHEAASDPATFALLSGRRLHPCVVRQRISVTTSVRKRKKEKDVDHVAGEELRAAMMKTGHGKFKCMCCKDSPSPSNKENTATDLSVHAQSTLDSHSLDLTSSQCTCIIPPSHASRTTKAVMLIKEEQELAQEFCETVVQSTATSLKLQCRGIEVTEHAIQQQANFQNALLEVLACGFQGTR